MKFIYTLLVLLGTFIPKTLWGQANDTKPDVWSSQNSFVYKGITYTIGKYNSCYISNTDNQCTDIYIPYSIDVRFHNEQQNTLYNRTLYIKSIGDGAFKNATRLKRIHIGSNIDSIGNEAFSGCVNLKAVTIENNKKIKLGKTLFSGCNSLDSLVLYNIFPPSAEYTFASSNLYSNTTLYVPEGVEQLYKENSTFSLFKEIAAAPWYNGDSFPLYYDGFIFDLYRDGLANIADFKPQTKNTIIIPDSIIYKMHVYHITSIADNAFINVDSLKNILIPSSVTRIGCIYGDGEAGIGKIIYNFSNAKMHPFGAVEYVLPYDNKGVYYRDKYQDYINWKENINPLWGQCAYIKGADFVISNQNENIKIENLISNQGSGNKIETSTSPMGENSLLITGLDYNIVNQNTLDKFFCYDNKKNRVNLKIKINDIGIYLLKDYSVVTEMPSITYNDYSYPTYALFFIKDDKTAHLSKVNCDEGYEIESLGESWIGARFKIKGFLSKSYYNLHLTIEWEEEGKFSYPTKIETCPVFPKLINVSSTPTTIKAEGKFDRDATIYKTEIGINGQFKSGDNYISDILAPNTTYNMEYRVYTGENYYENTSLQITTPALELTTTKEAKSVSNTTAIISATTNLDEMDTRAGFEWRRYDAPDLVPSSRANCPIIDGVMMGALKNLNTNTYYKFRPYYVDINGKEYFGDWSAFGTADAYVYFDPTVRTYSVSSIEDNRAVVRGCAVAGSDAIEEQGFEYWPVDSENVPSMRQLMAMANKQTVKADGQWMTATLSDLNSGQTYAVRAYVKTAKETTYGNTETFTTTNITGINKVFKSSQGLDVKIVDQSRSHVTLNVEGMQGRGRYLLYNLNGAMICNGEIEANAFSQDINTSQLSSGIYLLRVADNKQCKTIRIIVK